MGDRHLNVSRLIERKAGATVAFVALAAAFAAPAAAADFGQIGGGIRPQVDVRTFADRKFDGVVRQQFDFSCGSAALATLLSHHYGRPTTETQAFTRMWEVGDQERIKKLGFSLLEMKKYLEEEGLKADGFKLTLDRVQEIGVPGIALVEVRGYRHFVVIKGVDERRVLVGDPAVGVISRSRREFEEHWDGVILFVRSDVKRGRAAFNRRGDWDVAPAGPGNRATDVEALQSVLLNQTRPSFSGFTVSTGELPE
jgi:hypothetical protein